MDIEERGVKLRLTVVDTPGKQAYYPDVHRTFCRLWRNRQSVNLCRFAYEMDSNFCYIDQYMWILLLTSYTSFTIKLASKRRLYDIISGGEKWNCWNLLIVSFPMETQEFIFCCISVIPSWFLLTTRLVRSRCISHSLTVLTFSRR
jgi:hypothetical protein